jgi:hypothetical protein
MSNITPETLDKIDRFRSQSIINIKALDLPDELVLSMRKGLNVFIDKITDECDATPAVAPVVPPVNVGVEF